MCNASKETYSDKYTTWRSHLGGIFKELRGHQPGVTGAFYYCGGGFR